jgi:VanZ family protein
LLRSEDLVRWLCGLYWILLTAGLLRPHGGDRPTGIDALDGHPDLTHFLAFVVLGVLVCAARFRWSTQRMLATLCAYAIGSELLQVIVPGRTVSLVDGSANLAGVLVGAGLCWIATRPRPKREN